jgi:predicted DNA-binding transcriptional regulator YafY
MRFDVEEMAIEYALSFGAKMEVVEPESLREKVVEAAKSVIAFYGWDEISEGNLTTEE